MAGAAHGDVCTEGQQRIAAGEYTTISGIAHDDFAVAIDGLRAIEEHIGCVDSGVEVPAAVDGKAIDKGVTGGVGLVHHAIDGSAVEGRGLRRHAAASRIIEYTGDRGAVNREAGAVIDIHRGVVGQVGAEDYEAAAAFGAQYAVIGEAVGVNFQGIGSLRQHGAEVIEAARICAELTSALNRQRGVDGQQGIAAAEEAVIA